MKSKLNRLFLFLKKKKIFVLAVILILVAAFFVLKGKSKNNDYNLIKIQKGDIVSEVLVTGDVVSSLNVDLSFASSGKIKKIYVKEGDKVKTGDLLMVQDTSVLDSQLLNAQATLKNAEANYLALKKGATEEDIKLSEAQVENAKVNLENAKLSGMSTILDLYTKMDDAIRNNTNDLFENPSTYPVLLFTTTDAQLQINIQNERLVIENYFKEWQAMNQTLNSNSNFNEVFSKVRNYLNYAQGFLTDLSSALNNSFPSPSKGISNQNIDAWKTLVSNSRAEISAALSSLNNVESNFNSAKSNLDVAESQLNLKKAPPTSEALASAEAAIEQAQAQINVIQNQINQMVLRSPVNGVVSGVLYKEGEIALGGQDAVSIIGDKSLEIESYVSEVDVAKIKVGDFVSIALDAFPNETFEGTVSFVNTGPTTINGVSQYKIKVAFKENDERLKSGMTANLTIQTEKKENVLVIPQYGIVREKDGVFAIKVVNGKEEKTPIVLGIQDQNGNAEVLSGLKEGDEILNVGLKGSK